MADVHLPRSLVTLFGDPPPRHVEMRAATLGALIDELDASWPGMRDRLCGPGPGCASTSTSSSTASGNATLGRRSPRARSCTSSPPSPAARAVSRAAAAVDVVDQDVLAELLRVGIERTAAVEARHAVDEIRQRRERSSMNVLMVMSARVQRPTSRRVSRIVWRVGG